MNAPLRNGDLKIIKARLNGIQLPPRVKKYLIGAEVIWFDSEPLKQGCTDDLHYFFDSKTSAITDLLLKKHGLHDISQYVNVKLNWGVEIELVYSMPAREKKHSDFHYFEFSGTIFPMSPKFIKNRDEFYLMKNLEYLGIPDDNKNKKIYETTKFKAVVIGV
jgi:hypothetical protein